MLKKLLNLHHRRVKFSSLIGLYLTQKTSPCHQSQADRSILIAHHHIAELTPIEDGKYEYVQIEYRDDNLR